VPELCAALNVTLVVCACVCVYVRVCVCTCMCVYVRVYVRVSTAAESNKSMSSNVNVHDESLIQDIANKYNNALAFAADEDRMAYTIRDPLTSGLYLQGYASLGVMIMAHFVIYLCSYQ